jgi:hypothetical protein
MKLGLEYEERSNRDINSKEQDEAQVGNRNGAVVLSGFAERKLNHMGISKVVLGTPSPSSLRSGEGSVLGLGISFSMTGSEFHVPLILGSEEVLLDFFSFFCFRRDCIQTGSEQFWWDLYQEWREYKLKYIDEILKRIDKWSEINQLCD